MTEVDGWSPDDLKKKYFRIIDKNQGQKHECFSLGCCVCVR